MSIKNRHEGVDILDHKQIYSGYLHFYQYQFAIPNLQESSKKITMQREVVQCRDSVLVLIYLPRQDSFLLCQEFRPGVCMHQGDDSPFILAGVAGAIEAGGNPDETALREVYEEAGIRLETVKLISSVYRSPGVMTEKSYIYFAEYGGEVVQGIYGLPEEAEQIVTRIIKREELFLLQDTGKINEIATVLALNWFRYAYPKEP
ncbi:MAG: hypothetical protein BGO90_11100 [Legionella sp. 40-6]|nr:NUDIX domain-containing protein [Legionella sp.]OJY40224.1 MAG: hypothetical protein BGO90_11100 [Legionella sp. 40-6]